MFDVVVVGSGLSAVHAAYPLVQGGLKVAIIDGGLDSKKQDTKLIDLSDINLTDKSNSYNLLSKSSYVFNKTYQLLRIKSKFEIIQSLAKGGLSEIWHGISDFFSTDELEAAGLPPKKIKDEYQTIKNRIRFLFEAKLDYHGKLILQSSKNKPHLNTVVYKVPLVWSYRTRSIIENLKHFKNFTYIPNQLVNTINDKRGYVEIQSLSIDQNVKSYFKCRYLILAAGSINTTRILLRSFDLFNYKAPFLTKSHYLIACLHTKTLFKKISLSRKTIFGQVGLLSKENIGGIGPFFVQLYRFNSSNPFAIEKALKYLPLPKPIAGKLISIIAPSLIIADVRFPSAESKDKYCKLVKDKGGQEVLEISFKETNEELKNHQDNLRKIKKELRSLGLFPLKVSHDYVTAHYAGGIPTNDNKAKLSVNSEGKLNQAKRIYIADSSTWRVISAKPIGLTIMANAQRIGKNVLRKFH